MGDTLADGLIFRLAVEANAAGGGERVVFLALRGEEGHAECAWPIPLELPAVHRPGSVQLRLIADDGYEGPSRPNPIADTIVPLQCRTGRRRTVARGNPQSGSLGLVVRIQVRDLNRRLVQPLVSPTGQTDFFRGEALKRTVLPALTFIEFTSSGFQPLPRLGLPNGKRAETRQRKATIMLQLLDDRSQQIASGLICDDTSALGGVLDDTRNNSLTHPI